MAKTTEKFELFDKKKRQVFDTIVENVSEAETVFSANFQTTIFQHYKNYRTQTRETRLHLTWQKRLVSKTQIVALMFQ